MKNGRVRVLQFTNTTVRAGVEEHLLTLLRGFDRKVFEALLVCPDVLAEQFGSDLPADVPVVRIAVESPFQLRGMLELARLIRRWRPEVVHSHTFRSSLVASPAAYICGVPVIVETPHVRERWRRGWIKGGFAVDRLLSRFVTGYIAVSEANARYLVEEKGIRAGKVAVIRNGIDRARFTPGRVPLDELRRTRGFSDNDPVIVVMARLELQKGHRVLLQALTQVAPNFPRLRVVLVGSGALRAELEVLARALGLERVVYFAGYQRDPGNWLRMADITVLPSFYEGLPIAAIESLASGIPVVATAVDGTPEVVVDGKTGLTVPPGDSSALAESICKLLGNRMLREEYGRAGRQWVESHFDQEEQVSRTQALYLSVLNGMAIPHGEALVASAGKTAAVADSSAGLTAHSRGETAIVR